MCLCRLIIQTTGARRTPPTTPPIMMCDHLTVRITLMNDLSLHTHAEPNASAHNGSHDLPRIQLPSFGLIPRNKQLLTEHGVFLIPPNEPPPMIRHICVKIKIYLLLQMGIQSDPLIFAKNGKVVRGTGTPPLGTGTPGYRFQPQIG